MKFLPLTLIVLFVAATSVADSISDKFTSLGKYIFSTSSNSEKLTELQNLVGDTITFDFPNLSYINIFSKEIPDTLWIKKRPKKNPKEGKHFNLSYVYKGVDVSDFSEGIKTPAADVERKPFIVAKADTKSIKVSSYREETNLVLTLIDPDDLSVIYCTIPYDIDFNFNISSGRINNLLKSLIGKSVWLNNSSSSYPHYISGTLKEGSHLISFINKKASTSSVKYLESNVNLDFIDPQGNSIPFKLISSSYSSSNPQFISDNYYKSNYMVHTIDSKLDESIGDDTNFPFSFVYIVGYPESSYKKLSQKIDPKTVSSHTWTDSYTYAPQEAMLVGGSLYSKGIKFYKMLLNGKAFFMKADDVVIPDEEKLKLDSLEKASADVQYNYFHHSLSLSNGIYQNKIVEASKALDGFRKYGLAIPSWEVYDESEYTEGTGLNISFYNPTDQMIKYIAITFQGYNAVDDPVGYPISKKCIGPIDPGFTGSYNFDYMWFSDIVEYAKIRSITVTYKNGSTKTISNPRQIEFPDDLYEFLNSSNPVENLM